MEHDDIGPAEWYAGIGSVLGGLAMAEDGPNDSGASGVRPGDRIGKYTIIDRLGEGSFRNAAARAGRIEGGRRKYHARW